jgi:hypothetical protein
LRGKGRRVLQGQSILESLTVIQVFSSNRLGSASLDNGVASKVAKLLPSCKDRTLEVNGSIPFGSTRSTTGDDNVGRWRRRGAVLLVARGGAMVAAMSTLALEFKGLNKGSKYRPPRIWVARVVGVVLLFAGIAVGFIDGPDLQGHYSHPYDHHRFDAFLFFFLGAKVIELEMEVHWLKRHPEAR